MQLTANSHCRLQAAAGSFHLATVTRGIRNKTTADSPEVCCDEVCRRLLFRAPLQLQAVGVAALGRLVDGVDKHLVRLLIHCR